MSRTCFLNPKKQHFVFPQETLCLTKITSLWSFVHPNIISVSQKITSRGQRGDNLPRMQRSDEPSGYSAVRYHVRCQGAHPQDVPARQCGREEVFALFLKREFELSCKQYTALRTHSDAYFNFRVWFKLNLCYGVLCVKCLHNSEHIHHPLHRSWMTDQIVECWQHCRHKRGRWTMTNPFAS